MYQKALALDPDVFERHSSQGVLLQERTVEERAKFHLLSGQDLRQGGNTERRCCISRKSLEEGFKERDKYIKDPELPY